MAKEIEKGIYTLSDDENGTVSVAEDVIAVIAAYAATDVEGVSAMAGGISADILSKVGLDKISKGIKITINDDKIKVDAAISVEYGYVIPATSKAVQDKIKSSVESMTGLEVTGVNIRIAGVEIEG